MRILSGGDDKDDILQDLSKLIKHIIDDEEYKIVEDKSGRCAWTFAFQSSDTLSLLQEGLANEKLMGRLAPEQFWTFVSSSSDGMVTIDYENCIYYVCKKCDMIDDNMAENGVFDKNCCGRNSVVRILAANETHAEFYKRERYGNKEEENKLPPSGRSLVELPEWEKKRYDISCSYTFEKINKKSKKTSEDWWGMDPMYENENENSIEGEGSDNEDKDN
jgi:hypothetical protein